MPTLPADCNLLFGILALQNDFITRDQLVEAMNAWVLAKHRPLGDLLRERAALGEEEHALLDALVARQIARHGDAERSLQVLTSASSARAALAKVKDADVQASIAHVAACRQEGDWATRQPSTTDYVPRDGLRYRVLRPHARGGLGEVFVAEDTELHREVALKEIQERHAHDANSRGRFLLEAEITGRLEHPGIVPVYGLGSYADGRPFYAMRFIRGDNLKHAIERFHAGRGDGETGRRGDGLKTVHAPSPRPPVAPSFDSLEFRRLLGRFLDVCNAVAYAHSRGVLHRDLKPGNVMLGEFGETLVVDWGLAKIIGRDQTPGADATGLATNMTLRPSSGSSYVETVAGTAVGTPAFMSPEQADGKLGKLGPATDVYSLGATLYSVLTGRPPIAEGHVAEVLEKVRRGDVGFFRYTSEPEALAKQLPAPLKAICRKAMARKPQDRYATPLDLARDVEHWLADEPVSCYGEPVLLRAGRWMRRHRQLVTGAAALVLAVMPLSIVIAVNREQARQQAEADKLEITKQKSVAEANEKTANDRAAETRAVLEFVETNVFKAVQPEEEGGLGHNVTLRQALEAALPFVAASFKDQPLIEARLRMMLGKSFWHLGDAKIGAEQYQRARGLYTQHLGPNHINTLKSMNSLATQYSALGRHAEALQLRAETLALRRATLGPDHPDTLGSMHSLALSYTALGRHAEALQLHEEALALVKAKHGPEHNDTLACRHSLATAYANLGRYTEALQLREETLALRRAKLGPDHPDTLTSMHNLAASYADFARHAEALQLREQILALRKAKLGPDQPDTLRSMNDLANSFAELGRYTDALQLREQTLALRRTKFGPEHPATLSSMNNLAASYLDLGRHADALKLCEETLALTRGKLGPNHPQTIMGMFNLGLSQLELKNFAAAEASFLEYQALVAKNAKSLPARWQLNALPHLIRLYDTWGKQAEAEKWFAKLPAEQKVRSVLERHHAWPLLWGWPRF